MLCFVGRLNQEEIVEVQSVRGIANLQELLDDFFGECSFVRTRVDFVITPLRLRDDPDPGTKQHQGCSVFLVLTLDELG